MNADVMALWTAALRSGEFKQGTGALRCSLNNYCCLGVLCEMHNRALLRGAWRPSDGAACFAYDVNDEESSDGFPPPSVVVWAGLKQADPRLSPDLTATGANDGVGMDFPAIADAIEKAQKEGLL